MVTRILIGSDDALLGAALSTLIEAQPDLTVMSPNTGVDDLIAAVDRLGTDSDVVLLVRCVPEQVIVRKIAMCARVVMLVEKEDIGIAGSYLALGVRAVLGTDSTTQVLLAAIRMVAVGELLIAPTAIKQYLNAAVVQPGMSSVALPDSLTCREREVLHFLARGSSNAEIAEILCVTPTTVRSHVHHVLRKLTAQNRAQAVAIAYQAGFFDQVRQ